MNTKCIYKAVRTRKTREALRAHLYQVEVLTPRTSLLQHSFFWRTSTLWNQLPGNLFPDGYNLQRFKSNSNTPKRRSRKRVLLIKLSNILFSPEFQRMTYRGSIANFPGTFDFTPSGAVHRKTVP
ncbi:unnamed protein product [Callosobruchus maculatus]|uniref:Uncharacterized protein n=1 Tax=Callosobruchus maculatus TaxID=64391 RepID=A0A653CM84_CALMS|nr:unnamed protein product [Callosobruchus maculatus]